MLKTVKALYKHGIFEPLENVDLKEGSEVTVTIQEQENTPGPQRDGLDESFGGWKGLIDAEELIRNIYADRLIKGLNKEKIKWDDLLWN